MARLGGGIMAQLEKKIEKLEKLVDELMKDQPKVQLVKQLTSELGLAYSLDPVTQMNIVLNSMNSVFHRPTNRKDLEG